MHALFKIMNTIKSIAPICWVQLTSDQIFFLFLRYLIWVDWFYHRILVNRSLNLGFSFPRLIVNLKNPNFNIWHCTDIHIYSSSHYRIPYICTTCTIWVLVEMFSWYDEKCSLFFTFERLMANKKSLQTESRSSSVCRISYALDVRYAYTWNFPSLRRAESTEVIRRARNAHRVVRERRKRNSNVVVTAES